MENLREKANRYLEKTLENPKTAGSPYTIIDPQNNIYPVTGTVGDTHLAVDESGQTVQTKQIVVTCLMRRLSVEPKRGWRVQLLALAGEPEKYFIQEVQPDKTIGLYYFVLGHDFTGEVAA